MRRLKITEEKLKDSEQRLMEIQNEIEEIKDKGRKAERETPHQEKRQGSLYQGTLNGCCWAYLISCIVSLTDV